MRHLDAPTAALSCISHRDAMTHAGIGSHWHLRCCIMCRLVNDGCVRVICGEEVSGVRTGGTKQGRDFCHRSVMQPLPVSNFGLCFDCLPCLHNNPSVPKDMAHRGQHHTAHRGLAGGIAAPLGAPSSQTAHTGLLCLVRQPHWVLRPAAACRGLPGPAGACRGLPGPAGACRGLPRPLRPAAACHGLPRPAPGVVLGS